MSIAAFTNDYGRHTLYAWADGRQKGQYYGDHNVDEQIYSVRHAQEISDKPNSPTYSDHHRCTDYGRGVRKVVLNEPARMRRYVTAGSPPDPSLTIDLYADDHISNYHDVGSYIIPNPGFDDARNKSITSALNNLNPDNAGIGADLGQARQTIDEFSHLAGRTFRAFIALKHGQLKQAAKLFSGLVDSRGRRRSAFKTSAELWLEYSYGWKPLAQDIVSLQGKVHEYLRKPSGVEAKGKGSADNHVDFVWNYLSGFRHQGHTKMTAHTLLRGLIDNPRLYLLNGAGLLNPLDIAWELVPWSFVVDWFIPIGNTLQACTAACGLTFNGGWTTTQFNDSLLITRVTDWSGYGYGCDSPGEYQEIGFGFNRQCHADFPIPQFYANSTPYSTTRALNALSLFAQMTQ